MTIQPDSRHSRSTQGATVVVLGGTSGIGLAVAERAAERGYAVVAGSSSPERVAAARDHCGDTVEIDRVDILDRASLRSFFAAVGPFDHLVCTAGTPISEGHHHSPGRGASDAARSTFELGLFASYDAILTALGTMSERGSITLVSGSLGSRPVPGFALSTSLCGAIDGLVRGLAVDLAPRRVNAVSPGVIDSPLWRRMSESERAAFFAAEAHRLPVRAVGDPDDAAQSILHLIEQRFITGTVLGVDGGSLLV